MKNISINEFQLVTSASDAYILLSLGDGQGGRIAVGTLTEQIKPSIQNGVWFIGSQSTGVTAQGEDGKSVRLRQGTTGIEWAYVDEENWKVVVPYSELKLDFDDLTEEQKAQLKMTLDDLSEEDIALLQQPARDMIATLESTNTQMQAAKNDAQDTADHPTYIGIDYFVYKWNKSTKVYEKTDIYVKGEQGEQGEQGIQGEQGDQGEQGEQGQKGEDGLPPTLQLGDVTTLEAGANASAKITPNGTTSDGSPIYKIDLFLPRGEKGESGSGSGNVLVDSSQLVKGKQYVFTPNQDGSAEGRFEEVIVPEIDTTKLATKEDLNGKQDVINDLNDIRNNAEKGAQALGFIPNKVSELVNDANYTSAEDALDVIENPVFMELTISDTVKHDSNSSQIPSTKAIWDSYVPEWKEGKLLEGRVIVEGDYYHCILPLDGSREVEVISLFHSDLMYVDAINFFDIEKKFLSKNSTTNGVVTNIPSNAVYIGVTKAGISTPARITKGVLIYPRDIADIVSKINQRVSINESKIEEIGSNVCRFDNVLSDYNFSNPENQKGSSATYTKEEEYLKIEVNCSNDRFFTPNAEYFSGKKGDNIMVIIETYGEHTSMFFLLGTKGGAISYGGKSTTQHFVYQSVDSRTYVGVINIGDFEGNDLGIGIMAGSTSGVETFKFKRMCVINLGGDNDSRYRAYQELGDQYFIELTHATGFNPRTIFSGKEINYTWNNRKMVSIGDSTVTSCNWQPIISERLGLIWSEDETIKGINGHRPMGIGGSMITPYIGSNSGTKSGESIYMRADDVKYYNPDVIFLLGGINDSWETLTGTVDDEPYTGGEFTSYPTGVSTYSFYKGVVLKLIKQNPSAKVVCVCPAIPWERGYGVARQREQKNKFDEVYSKMIKEVSEYYGCLFVDTNKKWNINEYNIASLNDDGQTYGEGIYYRADSSYSCLHPNELGARRWVDVMCMEIS